LTESAGLYTAILLALLLIAAGLSVYLIVRQRQHEKRSKLMMQALRNEIHAMTSSSIGMGKRMMDIEQKLNLTVEKQLELENRDPGEVAYTQAARLVEMGADVDDLVQSCGIGRPEAELMSLLHRELRSGDSPRLK